MKFQLAAAIAAIACTSLAAPASELVARGDNKCTNFPQGNLVGFPTWQRWEVFINSPVDNQVDGCGNGYLDNYRGRCGDITNWGCSVLEPGYIKMDFWTQPFCTQFDITEATRAGSQNNIQVDCFEDASHWGGKKA